LESLGALTKGDRTATVGEGFGLSSFEFDNKWGCIAVSRLFSALQRVNRNGLFSFSMMKKFEEEFTDAVWLGAIEDLDSVIHPVRVGADGVNLSDDFQSRRARSNRTQTLRELNRSDYIYASERNKFLKDLEAEGGSRQFSLGDNESRKAAILQARSDGLTAAHVIGSWVPKMGTSWKDLIEAKKNVVSKFLNRILGLPLQQQNVLFSMFEQQVG